MSGDSPRIDLRRENYMCRIVRTQSEFLEKLAIIDAFLDDRIVEIYKLLLLADLQQNNPDLKDIEIFMLNEDHKHLFQVISDGRSIGYVEMSMETYHLLSTRHGGNLLVRSAQDPFVNRQWAVEFLQLGAG